MAPPTVDRFSALPDSLIVTILWLLPTRVAARTSVLSRRFRDLWKNSPSLELNSRDMPHPQTENFLTVADRLLLSRDVDSHPLHSLRLEISGLSEYESFLSSLFDKLCTSGLRHLAVKCHDIKYLLSDIFSMKSLETLSLATISSCPRFHSEEYVFPCAVGLTLLRSLTLELFDVDPAQFHRLISEFRFLEDLSIEVSTMSMLSIASNTIRKLNLIIAASSPNLDTVMLFLPLLEVFHLEHGSSPYKLSHQLPQFQGEIYLLRKAVLTVDCVRKEDCGGVTRLMDYVSHVQELILHVKEDAGEKGPFLVRLKSGKNVSNFSNLKYLEVTTCFCEGNLRAIILMLHHCPASESVKLVHELAEFTGKGRWRSRKDWKSKLPRNIDGNYRYVYVRYLHLGTNKLDFLKALSKKCTSKS